MGSLFHSESYDDGWWINWTYSVAHKNLSNRAGKSYFSSIAAKEKLIAVNK